MKTTKDTVAEVNRRLKTKEERAKDQQALADGYNKLMAAVDNFFEQYGYCEGDYDEIGQGHYGQLKKAHDNLIMPKQRMGETHIGRNWDEMTDEERKTSATKYWYEND